MIFQQIMTAIAVAPVQNLGFICQGAYARHDAGELDDAHMHAIDAAIASRRLDAREATATTFRALPSMFPPRRRKPSPRDPVKTARRREIGTGSVLPPHLRGKFTVGELAVLFVVLCDVREKGACAASVAEIGARAGAGRTLVRDALRMASDMGVIKITPRPRRGAKSDTNLITALSAEVKAWLARGGLADRGHKRGPLWREEIQKDKKKAKLKANVGKERGQSKSSGTFPYRPLSSRPADDKEMSQTAIKR